MMDSMTRTQRYVFVAVGLLVTGGLIVVAVVWGRRGVELVSWLAGVGSFLVAALTLLITVRPSGGPARVFRLSARARDDAQIFQAGGTSARVASGGNHDAF